MRVVYGTNQNYLKPTLVSMMSLLEHASRDVHIHVIGHNLSASAVEKLSLVETKYHQASVSHVPIEDELVSMKNWKPSQSRFEPVMLSILQVPSLFPSGRTLWLDGDTLVQGDVSPLFDINMDGMMIAAVKDDNGMARSAEEVVSERSREIARIMEGHSPADYFNSGVVVFDCSAIVESGLDVKLLDAMKSDRLYAFWDQDILNEVFKGRTKFVSRKWNAAHGCVGLSESDDCRIAHYLSRWKPWERIPDSRLKMSDEIPVGMSSLTYRLHANRLLEGLLGSDADVMAELD